MDFFPSDIFDNQEENMDVKIKSRKLSIGTLSDDLIEISEYIKKNSIKPISFSLKTDHFVVQISEADFISMFQNKKVNVYSFSQYDELFTSVGRTRYFCKRTRVAKCEII